MKKLLSYIFFTFLFLGWAGSIFATTVTFQEGVDGYAGTSDTRIYYGSVCSACDENHGSVTWIVSVLPYSEGGNWRSSTLIKFDLSSIPAGSTISSATLSLKTTDLGSDGYSPNISAFRVFKPWTEAGATGNDWVATASEWTTPMADNASDSGSDNSGDGTGYDRKSTAESTVNYPGWTNIDYIWKDWTLSTSLVSGWVNGTITNNGVLMRGVTANQSKDIIWTSSESATASDHPKLTVTYTAPEATPTAAVGHPRTLRYGTLLLLRGTLIIR